MIGTILTAATLALQVGYALNPEAPKLDLQYRAGPFVVGAQAVAQGTREGYIYAGIHHSFRLGDGWCVTPMLAVGRYHEEQRRKWWRFERGDQWDTRYMLHLEAAKEVGDKLKVGVFYNHITNLKNSWSPRAFAMHMNDLGGAGATFGITIQRGI